MSIIISDVPICDSKVTTVSYFIFASPMKIVLTCCSSTATDKYNVPLKYGGMEDDIEWMLNGESKIMNDIDTLITNVFHWSFYSLRAEVCLHLAKRLDFGCGKQHET